MRERAALHRPAPDPRGAAGASAEATGARLEGHLRAISSLKTEPGWESSGGEVEGHKSPKSHLWERLDPDQHGRSTAAKKSRMASRRISNIEVAGIATVVLSVAAVLAVALLSAW